MAKKKQIGFDRQTWRHIGFMVPPDVAETFAAHCEANSLNRSSVLRKMLEDYLAEQEHAKKAPRHVS